MLNTNIIVIVVIFLVSLALGYINYHASILYNADKDEKRIYKNAPWEWKFFELWNSFINFLIAGFIGYYFIIVRWNHISKGENINAADFILFFLFAMCLFRWFPYLIKNFTEGITVILKRVLDR